MGTWPKADRRERLTFWQRSASAPPAQGRPQGSRRAAHARGLGDLLPTDVGPHRAPLDEGSALAPRQPPLRHLRRALLGLRQPAGPPAWLSPLAQEPDPLRDLRRVLSSGRDDDRGRRSLRRPAWLHQPLGALRAGGGRSPAAPLLLLRRGRSLSRGGDRQVDRRRGDGALPADVRGAGRSCRDNAGAGSRNCLARSATAAPTDPSSRSGSASITARPSSATLANARSTTSPRSATWSTSRRACRARRRAARSSLPGAWSSSWPSRLANGSRST